MKERIGPRANGGEGEIKEDGETRLQSNLGPLQQRCSMAGAVQRETLQRRLMFLPRGTEISHRHPWNEFDFIS